MNQKIVINGKGFTLVELVIAVAIFMIVAGSLAGLAIGGYLTGLENAKSLKASALITESWEALRAIRNNDWTAITNGTHGLQFSNGYWEFSGSSDTTYGIVRSIVMADAERDGSGDIVSSGGTVDSDTKRISIELSWQPSDGQSRSIVVSNYLMNTITPGVWPPAP